MFLLLLDVIWTRELAEECYRQTAEVSERGFPVQFCHSVEQSWISPAGSVRKDQSSGERTDAAGQYRSSPLVDSSFKLFGW